MTEKVKTRTRSILRLCLALALLTVLMTMTQQETSQASGAVTPNEVECPDRMTSYWKLDEAAGDVYDDFYSWHDAYCTTETSCPTATTGIIHGAQTFSADTKTKVEVPASVDFDWALGSSFTVEFWMRTPADSICEGGQVVVGRDAADTESPLHWWVGCAKGIATATFVVRDTDGVVGQAIGVTDITDGGWHHIVALRLAGTKRMRLYVDGSIEDDIQAMHTGGFDSPTAPVTIGWIDYDRFSTYNFGGDIDELAIYRRALTEDEILDHATSEDSYCLSADVDLEKTPSVTSVRAGGTVVYTYVATNDGNENLTQVNLTDDKCSSISNPSGDLNSNNQLDIGETWTYTCSQVLNETTTNTATITAVGTSGVQVSDTAEATVEVFEPDITVTKTVDQDIVYVNDAVTYSYAVTHDGDGAMSSPDLDDDKCTPVNWTGGDANVNGELDPGETWTYTCSQQLTADTTNVATFTAIDPGGNPFVAQPATASVNVISPGMNLTELAEEYALYNQPFTYRYQLVNTGDDPLTSVSVSDTKCGSAVRTGGDGDGNGKLDPGETWTYSCTKTITEDETNIATATAKDSKGQTLTRTVSASVKVIDPQSLIIYLPCVINDK